MQAFTDYVLNLSNGVPTITRTYPLYGHAIIKNAGYIKCHTLYYQCLV
jgi:hypothetical protein